MRGRLASSGHFTEQPAPEFNRSSGRRGKVPARSTPALVTDSFKARPATASSAERQATVAREPETQPRRGLTRRPTGRITAGQLGPVGGTRYIFANRAKPPRRAAPVNSNIRPQKLTMPSLELKIPPPAVALAFGIFMWLVAMLGPTLDLPLKARIAIAVLLVLVGQAISVSGMVAFRRAKTTINPINPTKASTLVAGGIFSYTRNPMYVGLSITLLGWAAYLASPISILLLPLFMLYITRFQIEPEERVLSTLFGPKYVAYKQAVRRWL